MALLMSVVLWVAVAQPGGGPPPAAVRVDAARLESVEDWRSVTAEFTAVRRAEVATEQAGLVVELGVEEGDRVEAGRVLARLHDSRARLEVASAEGEAASRRASLEERRAQLELAELELGRFEEAAVLSSVGDLELDERRTRARAERARVQAAEADLARAESDLALARQRLEEMTIRAPFGGIIIAKRTELGQWLGVGDPVVDLVDASRIEVWMNVPDGLVPRLSQPDARARIRLRATGEMIEAPVERVMPISDPTSRLTPVRLSLDNPEGKLRPGMSVAGLVPAGVPAEAMTIHKDSIRRDDAGEFVFFDRGGTATVARIETLFAVGDRVAVRAPMLAPGSAVVVEGNERLSPGAPLAVMPAPAGGGG